VTRLTRIACVAALALAIGAAPLIADWCVAVCESAHMGAAAPTCHHVESTTTRIGEHRLPCRHDHHAVVIDAATTPAVPSRAIVLAPAIDLERSSVQPNSGMSNEWSVLDVANSTPPVTLKLASTLRI
jgi:hypothetical protein